MDGKRIIITGGSKGMGRVFVETLAAQGAKVTCLARPSEELEGLRGRENIFPIACDVSRSDEVVAAIAEAARDLGGIDVLVNNAAIFFPVKIENASDSDVQQHVAINVLGPVWLTRAAVPYLRESKGHVINISSESVRNPYPYLSLYAMTKGALESFSAAMREELREDDIRVTVLRSGAVEGSTGGANWNQGIAAEFFETIQRTGHASFSGVPATQASMTRGLISLIEMPADVNVDMFEVRGARAGNVAEEIRKKRGG